MAAQVCCRSCTGPETQAANAPKQQAAPKASANRSSTGACTTEKRRRSTLYTRWNPQFRTPSLLQPRCRRFGVQSLIRRAVAGQCDNRSGIVPNTGQPGYAAATDPRRWPLQDRPLRWSAISANLRHTGGEIRSAFPTARERCAMEMPWGIGLSMAAALSLVVPQRHATEDRTKPVNKSIYSCRIQ